MTAFGGSYWNTEQPVYISFCSTVLHNLMFKNAADKSIFKNEGTYRVKAIVKIVNAMKILAL